MGWTSDCISAKPPLRPNQAIGIHLIPATLWFENLIKGGSNFNLR